MPRMMIAAPKSGSGKTLVTCGILKVLQKRMQVTSYKCGPDYIDPMFHEKVLHTPSKNLDTYFSGEDLTRQLLAEDAMDKDMAVMEGVMGYYDGVGGISTQASSYDLARVTRTPVVLVVDGRGSSVSLAALLRGFLTYRKPSYIKGVIFNQISEGMYPRLKALVEKELPLKVYGYLPNMKEVEFKSRHLGLVEPDELTEIEEHLTAIGEQCEKTLDIEGLIRMAKDAPVLECRSSMHYVLFSLAKVRLAVAKDEAFSFYYKDNLKLLETLGAELVYFSPLRDDKLPEGVHGLLLGGGYPELHARELSENIYMKASIYNALEEGMPCIAECGGFLYLQEAIRNPEGEEYAMVGYLPGKSRYTGKLGRFGYLELESGEACLFGGTGLKIKGHEFHYMDSSDNGKSFRAVKPKSDRSWICGHGTETLYAGFPHLYLYSNIDAAKKFMKKCKKYKKKVQAK
ncbi:MAG TPA: cobyrinic acid a,c-diamide synthase [Lachnospiraceae bacterium]|nr:cobyrinic acid a,c-diamide synthase [Lachnospiraceae bacterium]